MHQEANPEIKTDMHQEVYPERHLRSELKNVKRTINVDMEVNARQDFANDQIVKLKF